MSQENESHRLFYQMAVDSMEDYKIAVVDSNYCYRIVSRQYLEGYCLSRNEIVGKTVGKIMGEEVFENTIKPNLDRAFKGKVVKYADWFDFPARGGRYLEVSYYPIRDEGQKVTSIAVISRDVTERKHAEETLQESQEKFKTIFNYAGDAIFIHDMEGNFLEVNQVACQQLGYTRKELLGKAVKDVISPECAAQLPHRFKLIRYYGSSVFETPHVRKDGQVVPVELNARIIRYEGQEAVMSMARDITERKCYEDQLKYLSLHDQLTGLYNRTFFEEELRRLNNSRKHPITIISADLDGLKLLNDTVGHEKGDELLRACAQVLKESLRGSDILARVGGDEFAALLPQTSSKAGEEIIKRIHDRVEKYNRGQQGNLHLSISIGQATTRDEEKSLEKTFKEADDLMYRDKLHRGAGAKSQIIQSLMVTLKERDYITEGHARRLEKLCLKIGEKVRLSRKKLSDLILLAHMHDLGKVGIPDRILSKKGPLSGEEWDIMRQHSEKGYRIALSSPDLSEIADLILKHHEWWDGNGYPLGLKGKEIPMECRILSLVDAFDAMTSERPYKKAMGEKEAVAELKRCAGTQFDPEMVEVFLSVLQKKL